MQSPKRYNFENSFTRHSKTVYYESLLAFDTFLNVKVQIKFLKNDSFSPVLNSSNFNKITTLYHKNISAVYDVLENNFDILYLPKHEFSYCFVEEFSNQITLLECTNQKELTSDCICNVATQLSTGLAYLHKNGVVHGLLSCEKLFVLKVEEDYELKISDYFNPLSEFKNKQNQDYESPLYLAPEQINSYKNTSIKSDIWSVGCCLYTVLKRGEHLFKDPNFQHQLFQKNTPEIEQYIAEKINDFDIQIRTVIAACLRVDSAKRTISLTEICNCLTDKNTELETCIFENATITNPAPSESLTSKKKKLKN